MSLHDDRLLQEIAELLDSPLYRDHPLRDALERLYCLHLEQENRLERLVGIADGFQRTAQQDLYATRHELERQLRRQRKLSRIADRYQSLLSERNRELLEESNHDALTGLANRRLMTEHLERLVSVNQRHERPFSLAMVDIDHFKQVNDEHGHKSGDQALVQVAEVLRSALRGHDHCGRWGGEEFLILLPDTTILQAGPLMTRLCQRLRTLQIACEGTRLSLTASIGIAEHQASETFDRTLQRADEALLQAKRQGRDRWLAAG
ncbi:biofilm regulation diguanylate cyclase SiaD [Halomonas sp. C05BenzN]|uniref:biofilm regulation diguanylate cyclase SiaD n=1 Tax=Halomonas sp. C05BenzN TaxID=3411041 RepID=UPI003B94C5DF